MIKYGLKLWSTNKNWFEEAVDLYYKKQIDFIELYIAKDHDLLKDFEIFKKVKIFVHAPSSNHDFNIFKLNQEKIEVFKNRAVRVADFLNSEFIILHAGVGDDFEIFKKNIGQIYDSRILLENKPKIALDDRICFGYSLRQLEFIKDECQLNICLDMAHAIKSALSQKVDYKNFVKELAQKLEPIYFHISGCQLSHEKDEHLNLSEAEFDLKSMKDFLSELSPRQDIYLAMETPKKGDNLNNDLKNIQYFKGI